MRDTKPNPVLAEVIRNGRVESCHRGSAVVVDARGDVVFSVGDYERDIYPRSAIKFFQALPLIESGAADKFQLTDRQLALACASHNAEPMHVDAVRAWLADMGLSESDLENGAELPRQARLADARLPADQADAAPPALGLFQRAVQPAQFAGAPNERRHRHPRTGPSPESVRVDGPTR